MTFLREGAAAVADGVSLLSKQFQAIGSTLAYTVPANTLTADGDMLRVTWWGINASTATGSKQLSIGGALKFTTLSLGGTGTRFSFTQLIQREGASLQMLSAMGNDQSNLSGNATTGASSHAGTIAISATVLGTGTAGVIKGMIVELIKAP